MKSNRKFLFECIGLYLNGKDRILLGKNASEIDYATLDEMIAGQSITGLFHYLDDTGSLRDTDIPEAMKERWKLHAWKNIFENEIRDEETLNICKWLSENSIRYVYLKGASVRKLHREYYIRASVDIDLFIDKGDYLKVKNLLLSKDYEIPDLQSMMPGTKLELEEYEDYMNEIMFIRNHSSIRLIIDLQWDFIGMGNSGPFNCLYSINEFLLKEAIDIDLFDDEPIRTLSTERQLFPMAFHFAFHHGFKGIKWLIDMGILYKEGNLDLEKVLAGLSRSSIKTVGICIRLINDIMGKPCLKRHSKKMLCIDRFLPFEYPMYKSLLLNTNMGFINSISHRMVKVLLPYRHKDKLRVLGYLMFNQESLRHRTDDNTDKGRMGSFLSVMKVSVRDLFRGKDRNE